MSRELLAELNGLLPADDDAAESLWLEVDALADPDAVRQLVRTWRPVGELRAAASVWSKYLLRLLVPPVVLTQCRERRSVKPTGRIRCAGGRPVQWQFLELAEAADHPAVWLSPWLHAVSEGCGVRPRVLWSNAGNLIEALLRELPAREPALADPAADKLRSWLESRELGSGRNPLYRPVVYHGELRLRRVCCLRYRLPDLDYCATCPLPEGCATSVEPKRSAKR